MMWLSLMLVAMGAGPPVAPTAPPAADILEDVGRGLVVNWSTLVVEVQAGSYRAGTQATKAVEQSARLAIDDRLEDGLGVIRVAPGLEVAELLQSDDLGPPLASRRSRWRVAEAIYSVSGKVDLHAELSLQEFLKPWTLSIATPRPATPALGPQTGLIVDARGTGVEPAFVPRLVGPDASPLWSGELWDEEAVSAAPCVWVAAVTEAAATRAGANPLRVVARSASKSTLALDAADAAAVRALRETEALAGGHVVILVDAP